MRHVCNRIAAKSNLTRTRAHVIWSRPMQLPFVNDLSEFAPPIPTPERVHALPEYTGAGVTIAFLDSGFYPHPDLLTPAGRIKAYADATGDQVVERAKFKSTHATSWHGTMTTGASCGDGGLSRGRYRGIASGASLVLVKTGQPNSFRISDKDIASALTWVLLNHARFGIRVINISLGGDIPTRGKLTLLDRLVEDATALGITVVCAAGNSGGKRIVAPASAPSAITVGGFNNNNSTDRSRWRMYRSSYGSGCSGTMKPELIAPAEWVAAPMLPDTEPHKQAQLLWRLETAGDRALGPLLKSKEAQALLGMDVMKPYPVLRRLIRQRINDGKFVHPHYQHVDGTSFAAPIVSAVVAQMLEANPALAPADIKSILIQTAEPLEDVEVERQGAGVINAGAAVRAAHKRRGRLGNPSARIRE
jgi:serine protease AprX